MRGRNYYGSLPANLEYNGRFTFSRIMYTGGSGSRGGNAWNHDYPNADLNVQTVLSEITSAYR